LSLRSSSLYKLIILSTSLSFESTSFTSNAAFLLTSDCAFLN
jgi:hypothetical protein